jgi:hypothetical protein
VLAVHDSPLYYEISEDDHPRTVTHARDHWWTLDFANAFVSLGVNCRAEVVPSHGISRRWLGNSYTVVSRRHLMKKCIIFYFILFSCLSCSSP